MRQDEAGVAARAVAFVVLVLASCQAPPPQEPRPPAEPRTVKVKDIVQPVKITSEDPAGRDPEANADESEPRVPKIEQVTPPLDVKNPPADAIKTPSGLIYKKLVANPSGAVAKRNDIVMINYTGWRQSTGETFFSNRSRGQPLSLNLAVSAPGFVEAMQIIRQGERAMLWVPASIGTRAPTPADAETLVFDVEVTDIQRAPEIPADLKPPANARALRSGTRYVVLGRGLGTEKARSFDTVTYNFTLWDRDGRQLDSTEVRKRPATLQPFRMVRVLEEVVTSFPVGHRVRFWVDADKATPPGGSLPETPTGIRTYELELTHIERAKVPPPPVPRDVGKPPSGAKKTAQGTFYKVLKAGTGGPKPGPTDIVKVHYTGWTTDGRMFDSSVLRDDPVEFPLDAVIPGWTDGLQVMSVGDQARLWIPEDLAYKGLPSRPQGMLVFDVELFEIKPRTAPPSPPPPPHTVAPMLLEGYRISGDKNIVPDDATKTEIQRATTDKPGDARVVGSFKLCLDTQGLVAKVQMLKSTGYAAYDAKIMREMRQWVYRPYSIDGQLVPVCTAVTFIYTQRDPPPP